MVTHSKTKTQKPSQERAPHRTEQRIDREIRRRAESSIAYFAAHVDEIDDRLAELEREWDVGRVLQARAAGATLFGVTMGFLSGRKWFLLPAVVGGMLLQHAVQGRCPPLLLLRRLGYRTTEEIDHERYGLMSLRGDFEHLGEEAPHPSRAATEK